MISPLDRRKTMALIDEAVTAGARSSGGITAHRADGPNQLWCWDITWLPTTVKGQFYYWYMMKDICSRKLVAN